MSKSSTSTMVKNLRIERLPFIAGASSLVIASQYFHSHIRLRLEAIDNAEIQDVRGLLVVSTILFAVLLSVLALGRLRDTSWPAWPAIFVPVLVLTSSPVIYGFQGFWIEIGWSVADVVNLLYVSRLLLLGALLGLAIPKSRKSPSSDP